MLSSVAIPWESRLLGLFLSYMLLERRDMDELKINLAIEESRFWSQPVDHEEKEL